MMNFVKMSLLSLIFCLCTGCIPMPKKTLSTVAPEQKALTQPVSSPAHKPEMLTFVYDGPSNSDLLIESIHNIDMDFLKQNLLTPKSPILIAALEDPADSEKGGFPVKPSSSTIPLIEDALTIKLSQSGLNPVERDLDILSRLYHEVNDKYLISISPDFSYDKIIQEIESQVDDKREANNNKTVKEMIKAILEDFKVSNIPFIRYPFNGKKPLQEDINIIAADYLLSFRVLECDVKYAPHVIAERDNSLLSQAVDAMPLSGSPLNIKNESVIRVAKTKLHLPLTDQRGQILWSDTVSGEAREKTPVNALSQIENNYNTFFKN